jgi:uncharacterized protein YbbK (DUF523 family)
MYLISSCLVGIKCRYNETCANIKKLEDILQRGEAIPVCPEMLGGLDCPRNPCEIVEKDGVRKILDKDGNDFTKQFEEGAKKTLEIAKITGADTAVLQFRSPSCGFGKIYSGKFDGKLIDGNGLTAELLSKNGIKVMTDLDFAESNK